MPEAATLTPPPPAVPPPKPAASSLPADPKTPMDRARQRMTAGLVEADLADPDPMRTVREKAKAAPEPPKPTDPPKPADAPPAPDDGLEDESTPPNPAKTDEPPKPSDETITDEELKSSKPPKQAGPWKLKAYWEKRAATVEQQNAELKQRLEKLPDLESASKRFESTEKRNKELEEEIRYQNYSKSHEFAEKYSKPYEEAWTKAVADLGELEVLAEDGTPSRKATANDLVSLARMPLGEARKLANQMFGDSASDVMMHRQKIRDLSDAQNKALDEARKTGSERQIKAAETNKAIVSEVISLWEKFNKEDSDKYEFLKSKEGDDEYNSKLDKAKILVDAAFSQNATDPSMSPEQRSKAVRHHAMVRNRAIAFSSLKLENSRLKAQLKEHQEKLKQFEDSAPTGGNGGGSGKTVPASTPMERAKQRLNASSVPSPQYY